MALEKYFDLMFASSFWLGERCCRSALPQEAPARTHRATNASTILDGLPVFQVPLFLRNIPLPGTALL